MLLPLLLLLAFGGAETAHLVGLRSLIAGQAYTGLRSAEMAGGVTSAISQSLASSIDQEIGMTTATVGGTAPAQPWGDEVCLDVDAPAPIAWPGFSIVVNLGGTFCGASDLPPSSP
jgi:hypothetical protein